MGNFIISNRFSNTIVIAKVGLFAADGFRAITSEVSRESFAWRKKFLKEGKPRKRGVEKGPGQDLKLYIDVTRV